MRFLLVPVAALVALAACGPRVDIQAERSTVATFGRYGTYAWAYPVAPARSAAETEPSLLDWRIRNAVDRALAAKGYVRTDGAASLLADYDVALGGHFTDSFRDYFRYRRRGASFAQGYEEGTLVLHLSDARTGVLAFRASASAAVEQNGDRGRLEKAVERMLAELPAAMPTGR